MRASRRSDMSKPRENIGTAKMKPDGTIILMLRAEDGRGAVGDATVEYKPSSPSYLGVLRHLGGLRPGEEKAVPPWPDDPS